jgi:DNA ligase 1
MKALHNFTRRRWLGCATSALLASSVSSAFGRTASAPAVPLATDAPAGIDPAGYLVSEKYDGVRALWDGAQLRFRSGRAVAAPAWFPAKLPAHSLDGELWLGRGRFEALSGMVRKAVPIDDEWRSLRYMVFELPGAPGSYAERAAQIVRVVDAVAWPSLIAVEQRFVADRTGLKARLEGVVEQGGEGLVLHRADAPYQTGRSETLLKLKPLDDAEAVVVAHVAGHGKYEGQLGALRVRTPDGMTLLIGTGFSDAERAAPPALGSTVTYTHRGFTRTGVPRFASFLRRHEAF